MAQFDFYGSWTDTWNIMERILSLPDVIFLFYKWYSKPDVEIHNELTNNVKDLIKQKGHILIGKTSTKINKSGFFQMKNGVKSGQFYIRTQYLGKFLDLSLPKFYKSNNIFKMSCGILSYPREYYNEKEDIWEKPDLEIKDFYKQICKIIKKESKKVKPKRIFIWVGNDALSLINNGLAEITDVGI